MFNIKSACKGWMHDNSFQQNINNKVDKGFPPLKPVFENACGYLTKVGN